jgi:hypothetical protein
MTEELKRFEKWWDAGDDIPNDGPYTPDTPIQFAWAGWQAALAQPVQEPMHPQIKKMYEDYFDKCFRESSVAQRTWVGLTRKEVYDLYDSDFETFHQRIEAELKEKNT